MAHETMHAAPPKKNDFAVPDFAEPPRIEFLIFAIAMQQCTAEDRRS
jgi:hypothetical protein